MIVRDAGHEYQVVVPVEGGKGYESPVIKFQKGPVKEFGVNGIQNEDLLDILIDRLTYLQTFEDGKYACKDNEYALLHLRGAKENLLARTAHRIKRGVEGTNQV